jgi:hypothetical protein
MVDLKGLESFILDNAFGSAVASGIIIVIVGAIGTFIAKRKAREKENAEYALIYDFLKTSMRDWRSPEAISRDTKLPLDRVRDLLGASDHVTKMINPPKDLWRLR